MSLTLPIPVAAQTTAVYLEAAAPTFNHYEFDADKFKVTPGGNFSENQGSLGKTVASGVSNPSLELSGDLLIKAGAQLPKLGDVIKPIDASPSPWNATYFIVTKSDASGFVAGKPVMAAVTLKYNPAMQTDLASVTNIDA